MNASETIAHLTKLLNLSKQMLTLLNADKDFFSVNNLAGINANNAAKKSLLKEISAMVHENASATGAQYLHSIKQKMHQFTAQEQTACLSLLDELEATMMQCQRLMVVNEKVAYVNMERVHVFFEKVAHSRHEENHVYEKDGSLSK